MRKIVKIIRIVVVLAQLLSCNGVLNSLNISEGDLKSKWGEDCPNADDIQPCTCVWDVNWGVNIVCTVDLTNDMFVEVFNAPFPVSELDDLHVTSAGNLTNIPDGIFHDFTFQYLYFMNTGLEHIGPNAFIKSASLIWFIDISNSKLTNDGFPFDTLTQYTALQKLTLVDNNFSTFPLIKSDYLEELNLGRNNLSVLKTEYFNFLPNLKHIMLEENNIESVLPGTFSGLTSLEHLDLGWNKLKTLPENLVRMKTPGLVYVMFNHIRTIEPNSMSGVKRLEIQSNVVRNLYEESWRSIFEQVDDLYLFENPIRCRCSMLWLAQNETLKAKLDNTLCNLWIAPPLVSEVKPEDLGNCTHEAALV